ncbi:sulfotransferase 1A1-like [Panulirus ornatus]|uniref:sulfotransferase 1A1-like n=1 Tax=Panulirus ornatus TaxID=150431 RepID=UPI003A887995
MSVRLRSGHVVEPVSEEWLAKMEKIQKLYNHGMVRLIPDGWLYPTVFTNFADKIYNFKFKSSDVVVMAVPKSGTTWMQEILWTMLHNPDLKNPLANTSIFMRSPDIESDMFADGKGRGDEGSGGFDQMFQFLCPGKDPEDGMFVQLCEFLPDPRIIKTHLPLSLLPPDYLDKTKVVYMVREPKDLIVSMYHFFRFMKIFSYTGSFDSFVRHFMDNDLLYTPYWPHVKMAWEKRDHPNLHFVFYEDMKADIMKELRKVNEFIGANLTEQQLENVAQHTSFTSMRERGEPLMEGFWISEVKEKSGGFFRKGTTGDWKNHFSSELEEEVNHWIESNATDIGITFKCGGSSSG